MPCRAGPREAVLRARAGSVKALGEAVTIGHTWARSAWLNPDPARSDDGRMGTRVYAPAVLPLTLTLACGGGGSGSSPQALSRTMPIDGSVDFGALAALATVQQANLEFVDLLGAGSGTGKMTLARWAVLNDDQDLYVALEWDDATNDRAFDPLTGPVDFDGVKLLFDVDGDGTYEADEDARTLIAASIASLYIDQHAVVAGDETDRVADGMARLSWDAGTQLYQAEFLVPLADDSQGHDGLRDAVTHFTFLLMDHVELGAGTGNAAPLDGTVGGIGTPTAGWEALPVLAKGPHARPRIPTGLGGLIVFLSEHENPLRDVYSFDPATGVTTRITNDATLFKDNVSLSHDRTRVAFHGAADRNDFDSYEIYGADLATGTITPLTSNGIPDGHPAWSPDDSRIAYASRREASFSIVVMTSAGVEIADLTPPAFDDNDPEYLPDGRILFKTDRFTTLPEVRIAVMDESGADIEQLTFTSASSDHDPVGDATTALFERFPKDTLYSADPEAGFIGWPIVEARLDGSGETILVDDGWVNWLPVRAPGGRYSVHLRSSGQTDARLIDQDGTDLGRLIPGQSRINYIDWK